MKVGEGFVPTERDKHGSDSLPAVEHGVEHPQNHADVVGTHVNQVYRLSAHMQARVESGGQKLDSSEEPKAHRDAKTLPLPRHPEVPAESQQKQDQAALHYAN